MRKLIFITILFLLVIGCSNNSEKQELQIEDTPTIEETIEEKGTEISFEDLIKELKSQNVITKDVNSPTISNHNPAEYKNYYNKGYIGTQENTELYIQTEYLFFQVVDSKKMIMNDEDLLSFKEDQFKSEKDYFLFWTKNYNYLDEKPSQHWYPYFEYQINKTDSEYGPIIEVSALIFNYRGDTIQEQYFWYDMSIQCGENIILDLSPRDLPFFGGTKTKNNAEQVLNLYIRTERPLLLERINKAQKICQNISYVTFKECDKNSLEKCKKEYVPDDRYTSADKSSSDIIPASKWKVIKDGGDFKFITGATITSRAVTDGVKIIVSAYYDTEKEVLKMYGAEKKQK